MRLRSTADLKSRLEALTINLQCAALSPLGTGTAFVSTNRNRNLTRSDRSPKERYLPRKNKRSMSVLSYNLSCLDKVGMGLFLGTYEASSSLLPGNNGQSRRFVRGNLALDGL